MNLDQSKLNPKMKDLLHKESLIRRRIKAFRDQCPHKNIEEDYEYNSGWDYSIGCYTYYCEDCGLIWSETTDE